MTGGDGGKTIPAYEPRNQPDTKMLSYVNKDEPFDPRITNEVKENTGFKPRQQPPYLTLTLNQAPGKPQGTNVVPYKFMTNPNPYAIIPPQPGYPIPQQFHGPGDFNAPINVVNHLVIGAEDPYQDHRHMNMIYEDMLPLRNFPNSLSTLEERITLFNFIKGIVLQGKDGEIIPFRDGTNNLFDRLKTTELNPYHHLENVLKPNPYRTLPKNMLIYRSCYPIKRSRNSFNAVTCSPDSVGMNLRIYRLTQGEMMINKSSLIKYYDSEVWREVLFYEYVRENIIKKREVPNFVMMIGYSMCNDSELNFEEIERIKAHKVGERINTLITNKDGIIEKNPNAYGNDILTAITESPTCSLLQWSSKAYTTIGNSRRMIQTGFHTDEVWMSIIFQIMAGMCSLMKHNIYINNFNLRDNVYIKDLSSTSDITSFWKYNINNVMFYVPNFGHLVLLDSKFKDVERSSTLLRTGFAHKIISNIFEDPNTPNEKDISTKIMDSFIDTLSVNNFNSTFVSQGGVPPTNEILKIISDINDYANKLNHVPLLNKKDIIHLCIYKFMRKFMNNRIGTILTKQEQDDVNKLGKNFKRGDIIVNEESPNTFKFVMFVEMRGRDAHVLTGGTKGGFHVSSDIPMGSLFSYTNTTGIKQNYKANEYKLDENDLLENYSMYTE